MQSSKFPAVVISLVVMVVFLAVSCKPKRYVYKSPPHYNFSQPFPDKLDLRIKEISGVVWDTHNNRFVAHNDEKPIIFFLDRDTKSVIGEYKFSEEKGDYEDIAMVNKDIYVLRSDGMLYRIVTDSTTGRQSSFDMGKIGLSGNADFETLYYDAERKALIMICKNCAGDDKKTVSAYAYYPDSIGFDTKPIYTIDAAKIKELSPRSTSKFQPSAARMHPVLKKLFILSSASNQLVIADTSGGVESVFMLARKLFSQPEGITFKSNGDMYISNEGVGNKATLLKFAYIP